MVALIVSAPSVGLGAVDLTTTPHCASVAEAYVCHTQRFGEYHAAHPFRREVVFFGELARARIGVPNSLIRDNLMHHASESFDVT